MTNGWSLLREEGLQTSVMKNRKFTNTAIPVFSGAEGWYQHIHIVQAIVKSKRGSVECGSPFDKGGTGVVDRTGGRTGGILPISGQAGGSEKAVREHVPSTGIGPSYICNQPRDVGDPGVWRYEGASARYDEKG